MNDRTSHFRWINMLVIGLFIALILAQAGKKFILDEVDFPVLATAISETGTPYHYRGETDPSSLGLWHPPLYAYALAAFIKAFGANENTVRAFGMFCALASAYLAIAVFGLLYRDGRQKDLFPLVFLPIFLLHPYTIANATVPDIDSTLLPVTMLLFFYFAIRLSDRRSVRPTDAGHTVKAIAVLSTIFALNLWTKLTTPLVLIPAAFFILIARGWSLRTSVIIATGTAAVGAALFTSTYWLYCQLLNLPFDFTFNFLRHSFTKNASASSDLQARIDNVIAHLTYAKQFANWITLPFLFSIALACGALALKRNKSTSDKVLLVLAGCSLFVMAFYLGLTGAFGGFFKYPYAVFPLFALLVTHFIVNALASGEQHDDAIQISYRSATTRIDSNSLALLVFCAIFIPVAYYQLTIGRDLAIFQDRPVPNLLLASTTMIALFVGWTTVRMPMPAMLKYATAGLFATLLGTQVGISRSQAQAPYPTKYHYGQAGMEETASYLRERIGPAEPIWAMKDIGHYANNKYFENYSFILRSAEEINAKLRELTAKKGVKYFVVTKGIGQDRIDAYSEFERGLSNCCVLEKQFGNFVIYKAR